MKNLSLILAILLNMLPGILQAQGNPVVDKCVLCEKLTELKIPDVRINEAITISTGSSHCKVLGTIGKEIKFELLLPFEWNGIFIMGGGGEGPSSVDWIVLIRDWVENGKPPERVIVSKVVNGKEVMTRPIFPYPDEAVYSGSGDPLKESNFIIKD
jgi:hypothetical protein